MVLGTCIHCVCVRGGVCCWEHAFNAFGAEFFAGISHDDCVMAQVAYTCITPIATPCPSTNFPQIFRTETKCVESVPLVPPVDRPNETINLGVVCFIKIMLLMKSSFAGTGVVI